MLLTLLINWNTRRLLFKLKGKQLYISSLKQCWSECQFQISNDLFKTFCTFLRLGCKDICQNEIYFWSIQANIPWESSKVQQKWQSLKKERNIYEILYHTYQGDLTTGGVSIKFVLILRLPYDYFYGAYKSEFIHF